MTSFDTRPLLGVLLVSVLTSCSELPGDSRSQGAAIGGATGAAVGAAVGGEGNRAVGAILGGILGAGGGYVIGAQMDKVEDDDSAAATEAARQAQTNPATAQEAVAATTADLNQDGFVTLDELVAMAQAGLSDDVMIERLQRTGQIFELSQEQKEYLVERGVSRTVVDRLDTINLERREELMNRQDVISRPRQQ